MKMANLQQGSPEWHAHRAKHFNASDAPAMLGCSPYQSRRDLLRKCATGIEPEVDAATAARFANGHRLEAIARPLAEEIVGEPLYAVTGVSGRLSASFDGLTLGQEKGWEHKALNDALRFVFERDEELPLHYRVQMEHQMIVSGAAEVLFQCTKADGGGTITEEYHRWYQSDPALRQQILDGWDQFGRDLEAYQPKDAPPPAPVGVSPETLPALRIEVQGTVIFSNLVAFRETAITAIRGVNRSLTTDQDFADAELSVKWCREVETRIEAAKAHALSQTASIDELFRTLDAIADESRRVRLDLEREVKARKEEARAKIVAKGQQAIREHVGQVNRDLAPHSLPATAMPDLASAIKGKRSLRQMEDAVDSIVAATKISQDAIARVIRANVATYGRLAAGHEVLFPDLQAHIGKPADDFAELVQGRIARHQAAEEARRLREDVARAAREQADLAAAEAEAAARVERDRREAEERVQAVAKLDAADQPAEEPATLNLGEVCDRLGFTVSAGFVKDTLGITPAATVRRSVMFTERQFGEICGRLSIHARECANHWRIVKVIDDATTARELGQIGDQIAGAATVRELGQIGDRIDRDESDGYLTEAHADALRAAIDSRHQGIEPRKEVTNAP